jgi:hypothetical protein
MQKLLNGTGLDDGGWSLPDGYFDDESDTDADVNQR